MRSIDFTTQIPQSPAEFLAAMARPDAWDGDASRVEGTPEAGLDIRASAPLDAEDVPAVAVRLLPAGAAVQLRVRTSPASAQPVSADIDAQVPGAPVTMAARLEVSGGAGGSEVVAHADVTSTAPLIGPMIEAAVAPSVEKILRQSIEDIAQL